jgi:hypothetical protein
MRPAACLAVLAAAVGLAGCGQGSTSTTSTPAPAVRCPAARSFMGCSAGASATFTQHAPVGVSPRVGAVAGAKFPDVSSYQGQPPWSRVKPYITGAVAKLGEGTGEDPDAAYNVRSFQRLRIRYAVYWFVRPDGCAAEGQALERDARALHVTQVVLDEEISGISGYAACLKGYVQRATGHAALVYRSASNDEDSSAASLGCWVAAYGPSSPPACFGRHPVAWQYASPPYIYVYIPGLGYGDVSVNYSLFSPSKPADPEHYARYDNTLRRFGHGARARERSSVRTWDRHGCENPVKRPVCKSSRYHLKLDRGRLVSLHASGHRWSYGKPTSIGERNQELYHRLRARHPIRSWQAGL